VFYGLRVESSPHLRSTVRRIIDVFSHLFKVASPSPHGGCGVLPTGRVVCHPAL
jgi:hypothetical protein